MPCQAGVNKRCQHFINAINGSAAVNMAGDLCNNLCGNGGGSSDRFRRFNAGIAHIETPGQHAVQVDQHAVKHREERRVVKIVIVDLAAFMGINHIASSKCWHA